MFTSKKGIFACFALAAVYLSMTIPAYAGLIFGVNGGFSVNEAPVGYSRSIGGATPSGPSGISINQTYFRDASKTYKGLNLGFTLGYVGKTIGVDLRGRRVTGSGLINRYTRLGVGMRIAEGETSYSVFMMDVGLRWYPFDWAYLRPHIGQASNMIYKYSFKARPFDDSDSEKKSRFAYGIGAMIVAGSDTLRFEFGMDYTRYTSTFGGVAQELAFVVAPTFYLGSSR